MNALMFILSIGKMVAGALVNPAFGGKTAEWAGYLNLALSLASLGTEADADRKKLNDQIKEAVAAGRGLTPEQRSEWRARADLQDAKAQKWLDDHPESTG